MNSIPSEINTLIKIMDSQCGIDDLEIIWSENWPLRWIAPVENEDYDYKENPLELDEEYEHSGSSWFYMISLQTEIVITKNKDKTYTLEDGLVWVESHCWEESITRSTPGNLPWYVKIDCKDFKTLLEKITEMYHFKDPYG